MAIEVLLRQSIEGVGKVGQVVRVREGYARNYLLPRSMAALVNSESMKLVEKDKAREAIREAELAKARAQVTERLQGSKVTVEARAGEDGHLYGSVGPRQALQSLKAMGFSFEERQIRFEPVRELGEYEIQVHLSREHVVPVKLWVVQDAREAAEQAADAAERAAQEAARAAAAPPPAEGRDAR
jgi:large subunit ribosomal protein L9